MLCPNYRPNYSLSWDTELKEGMTWSRAFKVVFWLLVLVMRRLFLYKRFVNDLLSDLILIFGSVSECAVCQIRMLFLCFDKCLSATFNFTLLAWGGHAPRFNTWNQWKRFKTLSGWMRLRKNMSAVRRPVAVQQHSCRLSTVPSLGLVKQGLGALP